MQVVAKVAGDVVEQTTVGDTIVTTEDVPIGSVVDPAEVGEADGQLGDILDDKHHLERAGRANFVTEDGQIFLSFSHCCFTAGFLINIGVNLNWK